MSNQEPTSYIFHRDYFDSEVDLSPEQCKLFMSFFRRVFNGECIDASDISDPMVRVALRPIVNAIARDTEKYREKCKNTSKSRSEAGRKGGLKKAANAAKKLAKKEDKKIESKPEEVREERKQPQPKKDISKKTEAAKGSDLIVSQPQAQNQAQNLKAYPDKLNIPAWEEWVEYKKVEKRFKFKSSKTEMTAMKKLVNDTGGNHELQAMWIESSMANGYTGIYPSRNVTSIATNNQDVVNNVDWDAIERSRYQQ